MGKDNKWVRICCPLDSPLTSASAHCVRFFAYIQPTRRKKKTEPRTPEGSASQHYQWLK